MKDKGSFNIMKKCLIKQNLLEHSKAKEFNYLKCKPKFCRTAENSQASNLKERTNSKHSKQLHSLVLKRESNRNLRQNLANSTMIIMIATTSKEQY